MAESTQTHQLFDRFINVRFYGDDSKNPDFEIITPGLTTAANTIIVTEPLMNRKPEITIKGTFVNTVGVPGLQIRITNLLIGFPIWNYVNHMVEVTAGYVYDPSTIVTFKGELMTGSQEKPAPDSITVLTLFLSEGEGYNNCPISVHFDSTSTVGDVLNKVADTLTSYKDGKFFNFYVADDSLDLAKKIPLNANGYTFNHGTVKDLVHNFKSIYDLDIIIYGETIRVSTHNTVFHNDIFELTNVSSVTKDADSYHIRAPWIPGLLPNMIVKIDPAAFKQTLGGEMTKPTIKQQILTVDFEFSTIGKTNSMELFTVNYDGD